MREIKFRVWDTAAKQPMIYFGSNFELDDDADTISFRTEKDTFVMGDRDEDGKRFTLMQYTGLKDKNGKEIYEGDVVEFSDKWEWYKTKYGISMMFAKSEKGDRYAKLKAAYEAEPMERRVVKFDPYEAYGLSKGDLESYWEVIGNLYENPDLIK